MDKDKIIDMGSDAFAGTMAALTGFTGNPALVAGGALIEPLIKNTISEISHWLLGCIQRKKIIATIDITCKTALKNINNGMRVRDDEFFTPHHNSIIDAEESSASKLFEGTLLKSKEEYDSKKIPFLSFLTANIYFTPNISESKAFVLLEILSKLSYRQLCALVLFYNKEILPVGKWESHFKATQTLQNYYDIAYEFLSLKDLMLIEQNMPYGGMAMGIQDYRITALGKELVITANLSSIPHADLDSLEEKINFITSSIR